MNGSFRLVLDALGGDGRRRLLLLAVVTILAAAAEFASIAALLQLVRAWLQTGLASSLSALSGVALAILVAGGLRFLLLVATQRLVHDTGHRLQVAVQRRVLARDWLTHAAAAASGPLAALELVEQWLFSALLPLLQGAAAAVLALAIFAALLWINAPAALLAGGLLGLLVLLANLLVRPGLRRTGATAGAGFEARVAAVQDHASALRELILAGARSAAAERFRAIDRRSADARANMAIFVGTPRLLVESVGLIGLLLLALWLASRSGGLTAALPTLAALALGGQRLLPLLQTVSQGASALAASGEVQQRLAAMLAAPNLDEPAPPPPLPFTREIRLTQVGFTYPGRPDPALDGIDLTIAAGERIALTGPNGSGKSTLADLVMGLLLPSQGSLTIDGQPLEPSLMRAWQRNVAHVPQAPFLANASIAANIAFMDPSPDHVRVVEAARLAGLHEWIDRLPQGYETRVGERGQLLSGGQRQRLALARALYAPAPLLVLDEATSALDPASEAHILAALDALQARGTTILLIAHRSSMLAGCNRVLRLDGGRLTP